MSCHKCHICSAIFGLKKNRIFGSFKVFSGAKIDFLPFLKLQKMCFCTVEIALYSNFRALWIAQMWYFPKKQLVFRENWSYFFKANFSYLFWNALVMKTIFSDKTVLKVWGSSFKFETSEVVDNFCNILYMFANLGSVWRIPSFPSS